MDKMIFNIIPAARMVLLGGTGAAKFYPGGVQLENFFLEAGSFELLKIAADTEEQIINEMLNAARANYKPDFIALNNIGIIALAESKTHVDWLIDCLAEYKKSSVPKSKHKVEKGKRRVEQKIVIVTGSAKGIGEGVAREMFFEGANIVAADVDEENGIKLTEGLNSFNLSNKAYFVRTDVSKPESVEELIRKTVLEFGGVDVIISNAGILKAGSLEEMDPETFRRITDINYTGFFYCAKYASSVMKIQNKYNAKKYFDIIQINSKSGLKGSNKNFAYAGGKFGGIGLTESFALELMPYNIKVNSVCPGNYFDGPLWSDPEKGLFVQYLKTEKVPGAKSIADVKKYYEKQVPAGRGCRITDITRAIYYAIEQEYETGQAIPVTGGQIMLK